MYSLRPMKNAILFFSDRLLLLANDHATHSNLYALIRHGRCSIPFIRHEECNPNIICLLLNWLDGSSSTPQVLGSTPRGSKFQAGVKKNPLVCPTSKQRFKAWPIGRLTRAMVPYPSQQQQTTTTT